MLEVSYKNPDGQPAEPVMPIIPVSQAHIPIAFWAEEDRPREKFAIKGRSSLTDTELLAILIETGHSSDSAIDLARRILQYWSGNLDQIGKQPLPELTRFKGIGMAKAIKILAALELGRRRKENTDTKKGVYLTYSAEVYEEMRPIFEDLVHEEFWLLCVNSVGRLTGKKLLSRGGMTSTTTDPKIIYKEAIALSACSIIICHNHPSGVARPSKQDKKFTYKLRDAGKLLDIALVDHLIFTDKGYYSFKDEEEL